MGLFDDIHAEYEKVKDALEARFGKEVGDEAGALLADAKDQAKAVVEDAETAGKSEATAVEGDLKTDAGTVAGDVAKDAAPSAPAQGGAPSAS